MSFTYEYLMSIIRYDPDTGLFFWIRKNKGINRSIPAGSVHKQGYVKIGIDKKHYLAHRLAWLYHHKVWPAKYLDHINGIKTDNRISNLRECEQYENTQNVPVLSKTNSSGLRGVSICSQYNKWQSQIVYKKKHRHLGYFTCKYEAQKAYLKAKEMLHTFNPVPRGV